MALPKEKKYTTDEFFAYTYDDDRHYELIDGDIVALAAPSQLHQEYAGGLYAELRDYIKRKDGKCKTFISPFDVKLDLYNVVEPDVMVVCDPEKLDGKRVNGAPDFVVEVVSSNYYRDYQDKLVLYSNAGVREYWIVDPNNEKTLVYFFEKSARPDIYTFDTPIPVGIYNGELEIKISDLIF